MAFVERVSQKAPIFASPEVTLQGQPDQPESLEFKGRSDMLIKVRWGYSPVRKENILHLCTCLLHI